MPNPLTQIEDEYMDEELGDDLGDDFKDPECLVCDDRGCAECDDDDTVSPTEVYSRAKRHFGGNHELAREAAEMFPDDFDWPWPDYPDPSLIPGVTVGGSPVYGNDWDGDEVYDHVTDEEGEG